MSKYEKLSRHLSSIGVEQVTLTFAEVEHIVAFPLPYSANNYPAWWSNQASPGHSQSSAWQSVGWRTGEVNLSDKKVTFFRMRPKHRDEALCAGGPPSGFTPPSQAASVPRGLTIAEAKAGLSAYFGVPIENVEIIIKG
jgi:hypothetical protein